MATPTYDLLESVTVASAASSVTFSSIDGSYGDLILITDSQNATGSQNLRLTMNSETSGYSSVYALGNGSAASSGTGGTSYIEVAIFSQNTGQNLLCQIQFCDYSATDKHKSILIRANNASRATEMTAARLAITAAITSITLQPASGNIASGTFNLYGVAK